MGLEGVAYLLMREHGHQLVDSAGADPQALQAGISRDFHRNTFGQQLGAEACWRLAGEAAEAAIRERDPSALARPSPRRPGGRSRP